MRSPEMSGGIPAIEEQRQVDCWPMLIVRHGVTRRKHLHGQPRDERLSRGVYSRSESQQYNTSRVTGMRTVPLACPPVEFGLHLDMTVFAPIESFE